MATAGLAVIPVLGRLAGWLAVLGVALVLGAAAAIDPTSALLVLGALVLVLLMAKPTVAALLAVGTLPFPLALVPGAPLNISASDLLTVTAIAGWGLVRLLGPGHQRSPHLAQARMHPVRPLALGLLGYAATATVSLVAHPTGDGVVAALQRALLLVGALILGGGLVRAGRLRHALEAYLLGASVLALGAVRYRGDELVLGVQKNPAGGFLCAGLVLVVLLRPARWYLYLPVLALGALAAQSRGALVGLVLGVAVTLLVVRYGERSKVVAGFGGAAMLGYLGFLNLPSQARTRLLNTSGSSDYAITYRQRFQADALDAFRGSPWWGVGVGNYTGGVREPLVGDPHQVVYLQLAEGGVVLLGGFVLLVGATVWVGFRYSRRTPLAAAALAVQVSTLTHALGDVYWVRGTPVLAFVLLGATLAAADFTARGDDRAREWAPARHRHRPAPDQVPVGELLAAGRAG